MNSNKVTCNHYDIVASRTFGKLLVKCEGCGRRKKWPWAKMSKCRECKKLWHRLCVPSRMRPAVQDGTDAKADAPRTEDAIGPSAVETRLDTTSPSACKGLGDGERDYEDVAAVVRPDCRRTQDNEEPTSSISEKFSPTEVTNSLIDVDNVLIDNTVVMNCEIEEIRLCEMTSDSNTSTVHTTECRATEDVEESTTSPSPPLTPPPPTTSSTSNDGEDESSTSMTVEDKPSADTNAIGKKVYTTSFLMKLESTPSCQRKPDCLLKNWNMIVRSSIPSKCGLLNVKKTAPKFAFKPGDASRLMPAFCKLNNYGIRHGITSQRPPVIAKCDNEQQEKTVSKSKVVQTSCNEVILDKAENAWRPTIATRKTNSSATNDGVTDETLSKNVRAILNKITPDNVAVLTEKFVALSIDTIENLENTIDLIFKKAIEEQNYAPIYATLCAAMQFVKVSCEENQKKTTFKQLIIRKCQSLFETDNKQEIDSVKKLMEISSCEDPENKKLLQLEYEEYERKLRKRSVGNCRFIGELFKQNMLNSNIMMHCIANLITQHSEEPLECLCNLLRTTGKELEKCCDLNDTFNKLKVLTTKKYKAKISTRIKFMILDIIDLRKDKWSPRRLENKPKMIKEIEEEVKKEEMKQTVMSSTYKPKKKQKYNRVGDKVKGGGHINYRGNADDGNVQTDTTNEKQYYAFNANYLKEMKNLSMITKLYPSTSWTFPSSTEGSKITTTPAICIERRSNDHVEKGAAANELLPSPKSNDRAIRSPPNSELVSTGVSEKVVPDNSQVELVSAEVEEKIHMLCKNIIDEYEQMHNLDDVIYSLVEDKNSCVRTRHKQFVTSTTLITLNGRPNSRTEAGKMFAELLSKNVLSVAAITRGLDTVLENWDDHLTDYPHFFSYVAAIVAPLLILKTASFEFFNLQEACASILPNNSSVFFTEVLQTILRSENAQNVQNDFGGTLRTYNMWRAQPKYVPLDVFIPENQINKCFKNDQLGVLLLSMAIYNTTRLINDNEPLYDPMQKWILKNINEEMIKLPDFVRTLIMSIAIVCSNKPKDNPNENFSDRDHGKLLNYYIRSVYKFSASEIQERESQCIEGSQIIFTILREQQNSEDTALRPFYELYRDGVISRESLDAWKDEGELD